MQELSTLHPEGVAAHAKKTSNSTEEQEDKTNFAQAALLLQNSSNVYSRKVEYLYGLVYKALDEFFQVNVSGNGTSGNRRKAADAAIEDFFNFDPQTEFLLLDDVLPEAEQSNKINLEEEDDDDDDINLSDRRLSSSIDATKTRLSLGASATKMTAGGTTMFLKGLPGATTSSSQQRALLGTLNTGTLRLVDGRCDVGEDGVLLMPGSQSSSSGISPTERLNSDGRRLSLFSTQDQLLSNQQAGASVDTDNDGDFPMQDDYGGDDDDGGAGFDMMMDDDDQNQTPPSLETEGEAPTTKRVTFQEGTLTQQASSLKSSAKQQQRQDPWAMLDPHDNSLQKHKPLRTSKTVRLPPGVDQLPSQCVTGARTARTTKKKTNASALSLTREAPASLAAESFRAALRRSTGHSVATQDSSVLLKRPLVFHEFDYALKASAKRRMTEQRKRSLLERDTASVQQQQQSVYDDDDDNDDYGAGFDFGGDDDDHNDYGDNNTGSENNNHLGMSSLDDAYHNQDDQDGNNYGKSFEELCREHIQAFAKGAEQYALNTKLTDRVQQWQSKLAPILEEEEARASFDIHLYSSHVIEAAQSSVQEAKRKSLEHGQPQQETTLIPFSAVTQQCSRADVCRMFLASLSLANAGNLVIDTATYGTYQFELKSSKVERPMETYLAPSTSAAAAM